MLATTSNYALGEDTLSAWLVHDQNCGRCDQHSTKPLFRQGSGDLSRDSGSPYVVDAYCPYMGAHLARNSTSYIVRDREHVESESIRCPFHGWRYGPDNEQLIKGISKEEGMANIRANSVLVGVIDAGRMHELTRQGELDDAWVKETQKLLCSKRWARAADIGHACVYFASDEGGHLHQPSTFLA